jgi:hypothetical protein
LVPQGFPKRGQALLELISHGRARQQTSQQ